MSTKQGMGRGLESSRLITAKGRATGGIMHVYSMPILILYMIFFHSDGLEGR